MEQPRLLLPSLLISLGLLISVARDVARDAEQREAMLMLLSSALVAAVRAVVLYRVMHGCDVPGLLSKREVARPLQLACALGPWETLVTLTAAIASDALGTSAVRPSQVQVAIVPLAALGVILLIGLLMQLRVLAQTSALTLSVILTLTEVAMIAAVARDFQGQAQVTALKAAGLLVCAVGVVAYVWASLAATPPLGASYSPESAAIKGHGRACGQHARYAKYDSESRHPTHQLSIHGGFDPRRPGASNTPPSAR